MVDYVENNGDGTWTYRYTVQNTSTFVPTDDDGVATPVIVDWELPWFDDMGITDILSPDGWAYAIEEIGVMNPLTGWQGVAAWQTPGDPWYAGPTSPYTTGTKVLHWYTLCFVSEEMGCEGPAVTGIFPWGERGGFEFIALYPATDAPYQASWEFDRVLTGDPAFPGVAAPASPSVTGQVPTVDVPEPGILSLLGLSLLGLAIFRVGSRRPS